MNEAESFDAFYARTVGTVTARIHEIANGDPQADHAIREAYARAYQMWYEISGYGDTEAWVLDAAIEAFERRRSQVGSEPQLLPDSGSWPGLFRPRKPADSAATVAAPHLGGPDVGVAAAPQGAAAAMPGPTPVSPGGAHAAISPPAPWPGAGTEPGAPPPPGRSWPGAGGYRPRWTGIRGGARTVIISCVVAAVVAASAVYFALGGSTGPRGGHPAGRGPGHTQPAKPTMQMLKANRTGSRTDIPWTLVGPGWTLAETSTAAPGTSVQAGGGATYLVDPVGGKYLVHTWTAGTAPWLLAWSGDGLHAVFSSAPSGSGQYFVLTVKTDQINQLNLPSNVVVAGFTRPDGTNLLAVKEGPSRYQLQRYDLQGIFQKTLASMQRDPAVSWAAGTCGRNCAALSSPNGTQAVWGAFGTEMQLVSNAGGILRRLHVPGSGHPPHCTPISWWDDTTVLASCSAGGAQSAATQLWLVSSGGGSSQPLTTPSGAPTGVGYDTGAWLAIGQQYVNQTTGAQCAGAPSGPGGLQILKLSSSGSPQPVAVTGSSGNHNTIIATHNGKLLVLAQMSCPGSYSLQWFDPAASIPQVLIPASASQTGVVAAVPWGSGTATAGN